MGSRFPVARITLVHSLHCWPEWASKTVNISRKITAWISPSRQNPAVGRCTPRCFVRSIGMTTFIEMELPVDDGLVQRARKERDEIRDRRPFLGGGEDLSHVLAGLRPSHAGYGGGLHSRA